MKGKFPMFVCDNISRAGNPSFIVAINILKYFKLDKNSDDLNSLIICPKNIRSFNESHAVIINHLRLTKKMELIIRYFRLN